MRNKIKHAEKIFKENHGILRASEAIRMGIHPRILYQMRDLELLEQLERGVYRLKALPDFSEPDLVLVAKKIPQGIICLVSALAYYKITTQIPHFVYVTIPVTSKRPRLAYPPVRYFWCSEKNHMVGVETKNINGYPVKMYCIEKTLADCVKFRNKIGIDIVIEALKMYWKRKDGNINKLYEYIQLNRVQKVFRPIIETILS